jgi:hypothetical protein
MDSLHVYQALALLRLTLACIPLGGYIHPDEYFQSAEPMAQDVFNVRAERTWDWIGAQPDMYEHEIGAYHQPGNHVRLRAKVMQSSIANGRRLELQYDFYNWLLARLTVGRSVTLCLLCCWPGSLSGPSSTSTGVHRPRHSPFFWVPGLPVRWRASCATGRSPHT